MAGATLIPAGRYSRADSAAFGPLSAPASEATALALAPPLAHRSAFPGSTPSGLDGLAPAAILAQAQARKASGAPLLYRGRLAAAAVLLALVAILLAIPVAPLP